MSRCLDGSMGKPLESFPVDTFPKSIQHFIESISGALPCPPDFPGAMLLAIVSAFIGRKRFIEIKPGWIEFAVLWIAVVARSGERKTPAFDEVTAPIRQKQKELYAEFLKVKRHYESLSKEQQQETPRPRLQQIATTDTTIEALKDVLAGNPNGILFSADELSGWARSMGQYKGGRGDDRQHWLSIWSGIQIICNRKGADPIVINDPFVSVTGGIQPDALGDVIENNREDGFSARILFSYPNPIPNKDWTEDTIEQSILYAGICESLWSMKPIKNPITFSPAAKKLWIEWINAHRKETPPDNLRPTWSKMEGHCARLALVLFMLRKQCNVTKSKQIDEPSIDGAIRLIEYFYNHAHRVYSASAVQTDTGRIGNALRWIRKQGGTVTARLASMNGLCKDSDAAKELFDDLAELGYGTVTKEKRGSVVFRLTDPWTQRNNETTEGE